MASKPPTNEAFLREVDEELRRDQLQRFGTRWGIPLIIAILVALAAFGGWLWWNHEQGKKAEAQGEELSQVLHDLESGKTEGAEARLSKIAAEGGDGYRATAELTLASLKLQAGDTKAAATAYKKVADDAKVAKPFRDLALVRQTATEYDSLKPEQVIERLKPLAVKGNPWFGSAGEMVAAAYLAQNKPDQAGKLFGEIAQDQTVPESIRSRAVQMAGVLGVDAVDQSRGEDKQ